MINSLSSLRTPDDVAAYFGLTYKQLAGIVYARSRTPRYSRFEIPKKSGASRVIHAPNEDLKKVQRKLAQALDEAYVPPPSAHGFIATKSIVTNSQMHLDKRYVFNVDLQDFFPSIHFGRVRGLFMAGPFRLTRSVATVLAHICCYESSLPQGAPTSPVISNMIARQLDRKLEALAKKHRCTYSRYVDDITFSFSIRWPRLPRAIVDVDGHGVACGLELVQIIEDEGFRVNSNKVYLAGQSARMEVTGITVNAWPNVSRRFERQVSAMLHAWEEHQLPDAQNEYNTRWRSEHRRHEPPQDFEEVVHGKLCFMHQVKGDGDPRFNRLAQQFNRLTTREHLRLKVVATVRDPASAAGALWVVESDQGTGTAFMLTGVGLVTCAHVVGDIVTGEHRTSIRVFRHASHDVEYRVRHVWWDTRLDLAILQTEVDMCDMPGATLVPSQRSARAGLSVTLMGFPNYVSGHVPYIDSSRVVRTVKHMSRHMIEVSEQIRPGLSGGPVVDDRGAVVAVLCTRVSIDDEDKALAGGNYAVLISELKQETTEAVSERDPDGRTTWTRSA